MTLFSLILITSMTQETLFKKPPAFAIDLDSLPDMNGESIDGMLTALRCIAKPTSQVFVSEGG